MSIDTVTLKGSVDLRDLAERSTTLRYHAGPRNDPELCGPCPVCGGKDRFWVRRDAWGCRGCGTGGDAIKYIEWLHKVNFKEATEMLGADSVPATTVKRQPAPTLPPKPTAPTWDGGRVRRHLAQCRAAMDGSPVSAYLIGRGFCPDTWLAYGFGYDASRNAVAVPWYRGGQLVAINYRRIDASSKGDRFTAETGGIRQGFLFGAQALMPNLSELLPNGVDPLARRSIIICEGELNCASIWQAAHSAKVDVLSCGAEGNTIPESFLPIAARYRACVVWKDKPDKAREEARRITGAAAYSSLLADGRELDANDHLQAGTLGVLVAHLLKHATPEVHHVALKRDLWDGGIG